MGQKSVGQPSIPERAFEFGVRIIRLCQFMDKQPGTSRTLSSQLLRCGTSMGANVEEGQAAQIAAGFVSKYSIALKEARESWYRLRLLEAAGVVKKSRLAGLIDEAYQLRAILAQALVTAQRNRKQNKD